MLRRVLLLLLLGCATSLRAQSVSDSGAYISDCLRSLSAASHGLMTYTTQSQSAYNRFPVTAEFVLAYRMSNGDTALSLRGKTSTSMYDSVAVILYDATKEYAILPATFRRVRDSWSNDLFMAYLTRGEGMLHYLQGKFERRISDTTLAGQKYFVLECRNPGASNQSTGLARVLYFIDQAHRLQGYRVESRYYSQITFVEAHLTAIDTSIEKVNEELKTQHAKLLSYKPRQVRPEATAKIKPLVTPGATVPAMQLFDLYGNSVSSDSIRSKYVLLNFWFATCRPCRSLHPYINAIDSLYRGKGLRIVGIDPVDGELNHVRAAHQEDHTPYEDYLAVPTVAEDYGVTSYPTLILLDSDNKVVWTQQGYSQANVQLLQQKLRSLMD